MRVFQTVWHDVRTGNNLDVYITFVLAVLVAVLGIFGVADSTVVSSAVLATLALLSVNILASRWTDRELENAISNLKRSTDSVSDMFETEYDRYELRHLVRSAKQVFFWGFSFTTTIPTLNEYIQEGLLDGLEVRFLLTKPSGAAAKMATFGTSRQNEDDFNMSIESSLIRLSRIANTNAPGKLEVRIVDYFPPYRIIAIDPHLPNGRMIIRIASPTRYRDGAPVLQLTKANDEKWFEFFAQQFEFIWKNAESIQEAQITPKMPVS
jgi:hypothetical protein